MQHLVQTRTHEADETGATARPFASVLFSRTNGFGFPSGGGRMQSATATLPRHRFRLGRVCSTGHEISLVEQDHFSLLLPRQGVIAVETRGRFWDARPGALLTVGPGERRTVAVPGSKGFEAFLLMIPLPVLAGAMAAEGDATAPLARRFAMLLPSGGLAAALPAIVSDLIDGDIALQDDRATAHVEMLLLDLVETLFEPDPDWREASDAAVEARVGRAEDIMRSRVAEPLSIAALARDLGIGPRLLQLMFQRVRGISPRQTLNCIRLGHARRRLSSGETGLQVTAVALESGFTHFGRFSAAYRTAFGEWPRQTLARGRGDRLAG